MDQEKDFYSGYLLFPSQGKIILRKAWHQKYCLLYKMSKFGIERLEVYDNSEDVLKNSTPRIITLENCIKITSKPPNMFTVFTKTTQYELATLTEQDLLEWVSAFQSVAFKDDVSKITSIEEDNDLYCSSGEGVFSVILCSSDATIRCGLEPKTYTLVLTNTAIQLRNNVDSKLLFTWPYCYIRRYGYRSGKFTFEAGRKCDTGEGVFHLEHSNQQEIFRCLSSKMKSMKKILSGESLLDCGDNQFQAALSMEARSRSPLPPSPTSSTRLHDYEPTMNSMKSVISFNDSADKNMRAGKLSRVQQPDKPPRKHLPTTTTNNHQQQQLYEPVHANANYDQIEYRHEAWRTLGVDHVKHTETVNEDAADADAEELEEYISWSRLKHQDTTVQETSSPAIAAPAATTTVKNAKILSNTQSSAANENYDKLQFFGSSSKLSNIQPGYKQVSPAAAVPPSSYAPSWNDYDEVETNMQAVRLADDSHLGYGVIRKCTQQKQTDKVSHQVYNDTTYAIVSKPKRV